MPSAKIIAPPSVQRRYEHELTRLLKNLKGRADKAIADDAIAFRRKWNLIVPDDADPHCFVVGLHRQAVRSHLLTAQERTYSANWLIERDYSTRRDTVFAPALDDQLRALRQVMAEN